MNCPSCGAPMRLDPDKDCLTCDYCKSVYVPDADDEGVRILGEAAAESCPVCAIPLMHASLAQERIRYCTRCRGMLIPMGAFVALIDELKVERGGTVIPRAPDRAALDRKLDCPVCRRQMDTHFYAGPGNVIIDDCSHCCLNWLDHGELMRIAHAPDHTAEYGVDEGPYPIAEQQE